MPRPAPRVAPATNATFPSSDIDGSPSQTLDLQLKSVAILSCSHPGQDLAVSALRAW